MEGELTPAAFGALAEPVRAKLLRIDAALREIRILSRQFNVVYNSDSIDVYYSHRSNLAILHIPLSSLHMFPQTGEGGAATVNLLNKTNVANADRLLEVVSGGFAGIGGITRLCKQVEEEFAKM